jgi:transcriptional regulator with XRE-family HTH domain
LRLKFRQAFGEVVRDERLAQSLTQREVGERGHLSYSFLSEVERGLKDCASDYIEAIAKGLGVNAYDLVIEAGYRMTDGAVYVPNTVESLFSRNSKWQGQYSDLVT